MVADTYTRQRRKETWYHFKYGTGHKLDHFLVASSVRRWVKSVVTLKFSAQQKTSTRSVQGRPPHLSGAPCLAHTDHDPVEMHIVMGRDWKGEAEAQQVQKSKPDVSRFLGSSAEAASLRQVYAESVTEELNSLEGVFLSWDVVAELLKRVALRVVGPIPKRDHRPWLRGKESELRCLESRAHEAELRWRKARSRNTNDEDEALKQRRTASSVLRAAKRRWEACWWDDLASKANEADATGDSFAFWQICRQLGFRESLRRRTGCMTSVADVAHEREAWRQFLSEIQSGEGQVDDSVWRHVPMASTVAMELKSPPSWVEFESALKSMKFGKRGGMDEVCLELIRFGGPVLHHTVFNIVLDMWDTAQKSRGWE